MGVDCYGLSPRNPKNLEKPTIDWDTDPSEEERQKFWEAQEEYDKQVQEVILETAGGIGDLCGVMHVV